MTAAAITALDRQQVNDALLRYTRGIDRLDGPLVASAFHAGALLDGYGRPGEMTIEAFVDRAMGSLEAGYRTTQHRLSNVTLRAADPSDDSHRTISSESYVLAVHVRPNPDDPTGPEQLLTFNGRYIDRFEERAGQWRIARRSLRVDWTRIEDIQETMPGAYVPGTRDQSDASYQ